MQMCSSRCSRGRYHPSRRMATSAGTVCPARQTSHYRPVTSSVRFTGTRACHGIRKLICEHHIRQPHAMGRTGHDSENLIAHPPRPDSPVLTEVVFSAFRARTKRCKRHAGNWAAGSCFRKEFFQACHLFASENCRKGNCTDRAGGACTSPCERLLRNISRGCESICA